MSEHPVENDTPAKTREDDQQWTTNSSPTSAPSVDAGITSTTSPSGGQASLTPSRSTGPGAASSAAASGAPDLLVGGGIAENDAPVDPEWIKAQRTAGWPDMHPEDYCHRCGAHNPNWWTDADTWATATRAWATETGREGICCPRCLIEMHEAATGRPALWHLTTEKAVPAERERLERKWANHFGWDGKIHENIGAGFGCRFGSALRDDVCQPQPEHRVVGVGLCSCGDEYTHRWMDREEWFTGHQAHVIPPSEERAATSADVAYDRLHGVDGYTQAVTPRYTPDTPPSKPADD